MKLALLGLLFLWALALSTSIAVMELSTWLLLFVGILLFVHRTLREPKGWKEAFWSLRLGPDLFLGVYFFFVTLGVLVMPPTVLTHTQILGFLRWIPLLYVLTYVMKTVDDKSLKKIMTVFCVGLSLAGGYGLWQFLTGIEFFRPHRQILHPYENFWRATGFFSISLTYAYSLGMGGLFIGGIGFVGRARPWSFIGFAFSAIGVISSLTRGAWLGLLVGIGVLWGELPKRMKWIGLGGSLLAVGLALVLSSTLRHRVESAFDPNQSSNRQRLALWESNWEMFKDHPWTGVGLTRNSEYLPSYYEKLGYDDIDFIGHAHSNYLQILAGAGVFGLIGYLGFILYFLWISFRLWRASPHGSWERALGLGAFSCQIFIHVGGLTECNFTDAEVNHMLLFVWSVLLSRYHQRHKYLNRDRKGG